MSEQTTPPTLRLVSSNADASTPVQDRQALYSFLKAKMPCGNTIEDVCDYDFCVRAGMKTYREMLAHQEYLRAHGLNVRRDECDSIVTIEDAGVFTRAFPHLAHVVPILKRCGGVIVGTGGAAAGSTHTAQLSLVK
ncbi:hypothetical protein [Caballeronia ptereochthonis]|uniref:Uncharacterized protein n=1 Tax=Caballeronia ptereochthonis TaxID=1777144 RepID=A0A158CW78_9BURK|nr:hypothetical protein [Caballeronia ptereochthonis]SAK86176.1 hypothetical protein AWB83_04711 [Caballeronia ptereochthonis]